ncbi:MAG: response regulator transcription factor [Microscillaceae bacterium]|jgi:DNA-binding NarL/FixJ family response regulator|nr:response regulator transcription factor [Microscillaceae bacterium]
MIKIAIADDHKVVREGICSVIRHFKPESSAEESMEIIIEANNGQELVDKITPSYLPDIVLMDLKMPILNGLEATKVLLKKFPLLKIIMLTMHDENQFILESLELGAKSYLLKDVEPNELKAAILAVHQKGFYFNETITLAMTAKIAQVGKPKIKFDEELSERELEVAQWLGRGLTNKEISDKMFIAEATVKGHCENIRQKMGVRNRVEIVIGLIQKGLIKLIQ